MPQHLTFLNLSLPARLLELGQQPLKHKRVGLGAWRPRPELGLGRHIGQGAFTIKSGLVESALLDQY
jgi:hypothetical protein